MGRSWKTGLALVALTGLDRGAAMANGLGVNGIETWDMSMLLYWLLAGTLVAFVLAVLWLWTLRRQIAARKRAQDSSDESRHQLAAIMQNASEGILVAQEGYIRFANPAMERLTGYSSAELLSLPYTEFIHPEDRELIVDRHRRRLAGERVPPVYEFRIQHREGSAVWVEISTSLMLWKGKTASLSFLMDITERRQSVEKLRLAEHALETAALPIYWLEPDGTIFYINKEVCRLLGYSREELLGKNIYEVDAYHSLEERSDYEQRMKKERVLHFETGHRTRSGAVVPVEVHARMTRLGQRELIYCIVQDITQRKRSERALRESEQRFRLMFDEAPIGALVMDLDKRHVSVNRVLAQMLGYPPEELLGKRHLDYVHPQDVEHCQANSMSVLRGECDQYRIEKRMLRSDGSELWVRMNVQLLRDGGGSPLNFLAMVEDINDRKLTEAN